MKKSLLLFSLAITSVFLINPKAVNAQEDTVSMMYYNILNFPYVEPTRADTLEKIFHYVKPDLLLVNELNTQAGGKELLDSAINTNGINYYQQAVFYDGPDSDNLLYYNSNKFGLKEQNQISTALRDISEYIVYFKSADIATTTDTIFYYLYSLHLKASQGSTNEIKRANECLNLKNYLDAKNYTENIFVGGDFNMYTYNEPAYDTITKYGSIWLYDPINRPGNWHNNSQFADIHTQSTRNTQFGGGSSGGMDDRFDLIFISNDIRYGDNHVKYISGSYDAIGQDGNRFNDNLISGTNNTAPDSIIRALYYMSDHLPVYLETEVGRTVSIKENNGIDDDKWKMVFLQENNTLVLENLIPGKDSQLKVVNVSGKTVLKEETSSHVSNYNLSGLNKGIYIAVVTDGINKSTFKFALH